MNKVKKGNDDETSFAHGHRSRNRCGARIGQPSGAGL
jgi:hypothetical protein